MRHHHVPGQLLVKLRMGEAPRSVATAMDVRAGLAHSPNRFGLSAVDRMLHHRADRVAIDRVHAAATSLHRPGHRHEGFDTLEHRIGLSRTFRVRCDVPAPMDQLARDLRNVHEVEAAGVVPLSTVPFSALAPPAPDIASFVPDRSRHLVRAAEALALEPGMPSVVLAILDTGVAPIREPFARAMLRGFDTVQLGRGELLPGLELLGDTEGIDIDPDDEVGHGTACAGIMAAVPGADLPVGLAGECTVLPVRVLGSARRRGTDRRLGVGSPADIDEGVKRCVDLGAKVLNCSFGTPMAQVDPAGPIPHADVVQYALARGCVVVAAVGNSGREEAYTPAALPGVLAVGAIEQDSRPSTFATTGSHVDLCAPGADVLTAGLEGPARVTGTSFAAPFASAAAALLVCHAARTSRPMDGADVVALLRRTARPWPDPVTGYGVGVLDAAAALQALDQQMTSDTSARAGPTPTSPPARRHPTRRE